MAKSKRNSNAESTVALREEMRQLVLCEGEMYEMLLEIREQAIERFTGTEDFKVDNLDAEIEIARLEGIALRAAFLAALIEGGEHEGVPPSMILGQWAGKFLSMEADALLTARVVRMMTNYSSRN
jgi:hypothetical protein